mgnify:CR=1 FL=1
MRTSTQASHKYTPQRTQEQCGKTHRNVPTYYTLTIGRKESVPYLRSFALYGKTQRRLRSHKPFAEPDILVLLRGRGTTKE